MTMDVFCDLELEREALEDAINRLLAFHSDNTRH
jgi:hypothetical protein